MPTDGPQGVELNRGAVTGEATSAYHGDDGSGNSKWYHHNAKDDGADVALGATADAAVTNPASSGSLIALVKGWLTGLGAQADAAATSGDGSLIALVKGVRSLLTTYFATPVNASTTALASSLVIKASAGTLWGLQGYHSGAAVGYIQLHNTTTVPIDTAVPVVVIKVPAGESFSIDFGRVGRKFATGITAVLSTTGPTKTLGAAEAWIDAQYT